MLRNLFKVAVRNFFRQRFYSLINVVGLASGLVCTLFIYLWVKDEVQKDTVYPESEKIFHIVSNLGNPGGETITWNITPGPLADDIRDNSAGIERIARLANTGSLLVQAGDQRLMERGYYADPDFIPLFGFKIQTGTPATKPDDIASISLSASLARRLFGDEAAVGKTVKVNNKLDLTVVAVFEDLPATSSFTFDYILPFELYRKNRGDGFNWGNFDHPLYVKLQDPTQATAFINDLNARRVKAKDSEGVSYYIQPFADYYLHGQYENGVPVGGRIRYVQIFSVVALFILVIACINFMNMTTARAANRAKEVGVRKVAGAVRRSLVSQFLVESLLISLVAMVVAVGVVYIALPVFNILVNKHIVLPWGDPELWLALLGIVLITGVLAGSYPAFFLSAYQPAQVLKGNLSPMFSGQGLRRLLVVFQFSLTVMLIASSLVIYQQLDYIQHKNIGYNRHAVLTFRLRGDLASAYERFRIEALQLPAITQVSRADQSLVQVENQNGSVDWPGRTDDTQQLFRTVVVDYNYPETMGLTLREGRFFSEAQDDTSTFLLTAKAVEAMGLREPVGTVISQWGIKGKVIGVVEDFHGRSLQELLDPIVLMCNPAWARQVFVRFDAAQTSTAVAGLQTLYQKYLPEFPFAYTFLEDDFNTLYQNENITGKLALGFTTMAILISALGLLGLAAYTTERKRKEISIRKVLGASASSIVALISADFVKLSLIAAIIGCPLAYYAATRFLEGYAYHIDITWDIFAMTALAVMAIALITVVFQVMRAALANPADALRND